MISIILIHYVLLISSSRPHSYCDNFSTSQKKKHYSQYCYITICNLFTTLLQHLYKTSLSIFLYQGTINQDAILHAHYFLTHHIYIYIYTFTSIILLPLPFLLYLLITTLLNTILPFYLSPLPFIRCHNCCIQRFALQFSIYYNF